MDSTKNSKPATKEPPLKINASFDKAVKIIMNPTKPVGKAKNKGK